MNLLKMNLHHLSAVMSTKFLGTATIFARYKTEITPSEVDIICTAVNTHPYPRKPMAPDLYSLRVHPMPPALLREVMKRLWVGLADTQKTLCFLRWARRSDRQNPPSSAPYEIMLEMLTRTRQFDLAWKFLGDMKREFKVTMKAVKIMLHSYVKHATFEETLAAFDRMEYYANSKGMDTYFFNILLEGFCKWKDIHMTRAVFYRLHDRFPPDVYTYNILLDGFRRAGNVVATEMFFRQLITRGIKPNNVTYSIMITGLCRRRKFRDALELFHTMKKEGCQPDVQMYTALIYGLGRACKIRLAGQLFEEMEASGIKPDLIAYNALIVAFCRAKLVDEALGVMNEMEMKGVDCNSITYHRILFCLIEAWDTRKVKDLFYKMVSDGFTPRVFVVELLMKFFVKLRRMNMAIQLWRYIISKGCCPHGYVTDYLVIKLCYRGNLQMAYDCCLHLAKRGKLPPKKAMLTLREFLIPSLWGQKLDRLDKIVRGRKALMESRKVYTKPKEDADSSFLETGDSI